jgi:hypothetical protein
MLVPLGRKTWRTTKVKITPVHITPRYTLILHEEFSPLELPWAQRPSTLKGCVGPLQDGYIRDVPLP